MKTIVQMKQFVNDTESYINAWLEQIKAEDIVSVSFHVTSYQEATDEYTTVFYRTTVTE